MDSKEFFETNKEKIHATAEFLCTKNSSKNIEEQFDELKQQYLNGEGTNHKEVIKINDYELDIKAWLDTIRHKEIENFVIIAMYNEKSQIIFSKTGDQFSSPEMELNDIDAKIVELLTFGGARSVGVYVMHNHPFIYRASPSKADCIALEAIYNELVNIENTVKSLCRNCQIALIDFAIVTEFDYWSFKQSI